MCPENVEQTDVFEELFNTAKGLCLENKDARWKNLNIGKRTKALIAINRYDMDDGGNLIKNLEKGVFNVNPAKMIPKIANRNLDLMVSETYVTIPEQFQIIYYYFLKLPSENEKVNQKVKENIDFWCDRINNNGYDSDTPNKPDLVLLQRAASLIQVLSKIRQLDTSPPEEAWKIENHESLKSRDAKKFKQNFITRCRLLDEVSEQFDSLYTKMNQTLEYDKYQPTPSYFNVILQERLGKIQYEIWERRDETYKIIPADEFRNQFKLSDSAFKREDENSEYIRRLYEGSPTMFEPVFSMARRMTNETRVQRKSELNEFYYGVDSRGKIEGLDASMNLANREKAAKKQYQTIPEQFQILHHVFITDPKDTDEAENNFSAAMFWCKKIKENNLPHMPDKQANVAEVGRDAQLVRSMVEFQESKGASEVEFGKMRLELNKVKTEELTAKEAQANSMQEARAQMEITYLGLAAELIEVQVKIKRFQRYWNNDITTKMLGSDISMVNNNKAIKHFTTMYRMIDDANKLYKEIQPTINALRIDSVTGQSTHDAMIDDLNKTGERIDMDSNNMLKVLTSQSIQTFLGDQDAIKGYKHTAEYSEDEDEKKNIAFLDEIAPKTDKLQKVFPPIMDLAKSLCIDNNPKRSKELTFEKVFYSMREDGDITHKFHLTRKMRSNIIMANETYRTIPEQFQIISYYFSKIPHTESDYNNAMFWCEKIKTNEYHDAIELESDPSIRAVQLAGQLQGVYLKIERYKRMKEESIRQNMMLNPKKDIRTKNNKHLLTMNRMLFEALNEFNVICPKIDTTLSELTKNMDEEKKVEKRGLLEYVTDDIRKKAQWLKDFNADKLKTKKQDRRFDAWTPPSTGVFIAGPFVAFGLLTDSKKTPLNVVGAAFVGIIVEALGVAFSPLIVGGSVVHDIIELSGFAGHKARDKIISMKSDEDDSLNLEFLIKLKENAIINEKNMYQTAYNDTGAPALYERITEALAEIDRMKERETTPFYHGAYYKEVTPDQKTKKLEELLKSHETKIRELINKHNVTSEQEKIIRLGCKQGEALDTKVIEISKTIDMYNKRFTFEEALSVAKDAHYSINKLAEECREILDAPRRLVSLKDRTKELTRVAKNYVKEYDGIVTEQRKELLQEVKFPNINDAEAEMKERESKYMEILKKEIKKLEDEGKIVKPQGHQTYRRW